jgi:hypothetical protein
VINLIVKKEVKRALVTSFQRGLSKILFKVVYGKINNLTIELDKRVWEDGNNLLNFIVQKRRRMLNTRTQLKRGVMKKWNMMIIILHKLKWRGMYG